jgi:hypothetical protein
VSHFDNSNTISNFFIIIIIIIIIKLLLNPDQIYSSGKSAVSRPPSPPTGVPTLDCASGSISSEGALVEGIDTLG